MRADCVSCADYRLRGERFCGRCGARLHDIPRADAARAHAEHELAPLLRRGYGALKPHRPDGADDTLLYAVRPPRLARSAEGWVWLDVYCAPRRGPLAHRRSVEYPLADVADWLGPDGWIPFEPAGAAVPDPIDLRAALTASAPAPPRAATPTLPVSVTPLRAALWLACLLPGLLLLAVAPLPAVACLLAGVGLALLLDAGPRTVPAHRTAEPPTRPVTAPAPAPAPSVRAHRLTA